MKRQNWVVLALLAVAVSVGCIQSQSASSAPPAGSTEPSRNPFGVKLEPVPDDEEVRAFAKHVTLSGADQDPNAAQWADTVASAKGNAIDGDWSGRWKYYGPNMPWVTQTEATKAATVGNRMYFLFTYHEGAYLVVTVPDGKDRLRGRFMSVRDPRDTGVFAGLMVGNDRIDGEWKGPAGAGRWDFRRKLK